MITFHGLFFKNIARFWLNLRTLAYYNRTLFEIGFVLLYAFEQILLIWFTFNSQSLIQLSFIVSVFAVIVLTTFALHKILMESRIKVLEQKLDNTIYRNLALKSKKDEISDKYNGLLEFLYSTDSQYLYTSMFNNTKRGKR